jgi:hypothetical protein
MTRFEYIGNNILFIKEGVMFGFISTCILSHFRIYTQYLNYLSLGLSIPQVVFILAEENRVSEQTVYRIKWEMETEL